MLADTGKSLYSVVLVVDEEIFSSETVIALNEEQAKADILLDHSKLIHDEDVPAGQDKHEVEIFVRPF